MVTTSRDNIDLHEITNIFARVGVTYRRGFGFYDWIY
jgi:hypothetical protein